MARKYKLEVQRDGVNAILYYHDDGTIELIDADSGEKLQYLQDKLVISDLLFKWMDTFNVETFECSKV